MVAVSVALIIVVVFVFIVAVGVIASVVSNKFNVNKNKSCSARRFGGAEKFNSAVGSVNSNKSVVHANCDHTKEQTARISLVDVAEMDWDEFRKFVLALISKDYPTAKLSPYKYRGSADILFERKGKPLEVHLILVKRGTSVPESDFSSAVREINVKDEAQDWILSNGNFSVMQRASASSKNINLIDGAELYKLMKRHDISAKDYTRKLD